MNSATKVLVFGLYPDLGHIGPLARIGKKLAAAGIDCTFLLPGDSKPIVEQLDIDTLYNPSVLEEADKGVFDQISRFSSFEKLFRTEHLINQQYSNPILRRILVSIPEVVEKVVSIAPTHLLVDNHFMTRTIYQTLAQRIGSKLIYHDVHGNHMHRGTIHGDEKSSRAPLEAALGLNAFIVRLNRLTGRILDKAFHFLQRMESPRPSILERVALQTAISDKIVSILPREQTVPKPKTVSFGIPYIVKNFVTMENESDGSLYPPIVLSADTSNDAPVEEIAHDEPFIYVALGTLLNGQVRTLLSIAKALLWYRGTILWAIANPPPEFLEFTEKFPDFKILRFLDQNRVLQTKGIDCFITHGGASSIQEGLVNAVPMVVVPFLFDQHFNASVVARLETGRAVNSNRLTERGLRTALRAVVGSPPVLERCKTVQNRLLEASSKIEFPSVLEVP